MAMIWHGEAFEKDMLKTMHKRMVKATLLVERVAKHSMRKGGRTETGFIQEGKKPSRIGSFRSKANEPPRTQTGTLSRSITHEVEPNLSTAITSLHGVFKGFVGRVGTNLSYAMAMERGSPPHIIRAKRAKVLAARIGTNKWNVFGKFVRHPGNAPRPFLRPAYHRSMGGIRSIFSRPMDRI